MTFDLARLVPGARLVLPGSDEEVRLLTVTAGPFYDLFYEGPSGLGRVTLAEDELASIRVVDVPERLPFDADPVLFRLGIEARQIQVSFEHDMAALAVSNIQPLPHQIEAVYDCFLREPRVRFLLADDPGAGKTIMAGLYMKELILRRSGDRILVVTPANLRPQWARELAERFDLDFVQMDSAMFDATPTLNPWDQHDRVIVSRDFLKAERVREAFEAADREWDLAVLDEAHGYTIAIDGKGYIKDRSERYKAAEHVSRKAHRLILLTATPHSGRDESLWALLRLLDMDAWGDKCPRHLEVPDRLYRKVPKEKMKDMAGNDLFLSRHPHTLDYELEGEEFALYNAVTDFVERQLREIKGENSKSAAGFALTTMQRRLASSVRAIRRTLERRVARLEVAIEDPEAYLRSRRAFQASLFDDDADSDTDDLAEEERWALEERALEEWLPSTLVELEAERDALGPLLAQAQDLEAKRSERKLTELLEVIHSQGLLEDRSKQLLIFTEHKDTLDYLVENLQGDFEVAVIHGGLKLAERIAQERLFRERAQIMVATEAAGEGINLQFCHLMVNYDIPWNPNRLEQRMGRIHRIGQTSEVHVFNLVAGNTREGYVLKTILKKMENMGKALGDPVFDVIGKTFAGYRLRELIEAVLAGDKTKEEAAAELGGEEADPEIQARAEVLLDRALARNYLDWQTERERAERAEERRLPPAYFERFFVEAIEHAGGKIEKRLDPGSLRVTRTPDLLVARSRAAGATRRVAATYERLTFDKAVATRPRRDPTETALPQAELCGPGHPLFDALIEDMIGRTATAVARGSILIDPDADTPRAVRFLAGDAVDGNNELVHRSTAAVRLEPGHPPQRSRSQSLYDLALPKTPAAVAELQLPDDDNTVMWARQHLFEERYQDAKRERETVADIQLDFLRRSFNGLLSAADQAVIAAEEDVERGAQGAEGRLRRAEVAKNVQVVKRDERIAAAERGKAVRRGPVSVLGTVLVIPFNQPTSERAREQRASNEEVEATAVRISRVYEEDRGARVETVERDNVGFDLLSTLGLERRCIEVKGRAGVGSVELTWGEYAKATELGADYWLYVVLDCSTPGPRLYRVQDPIRTLAGAWHPNLDVRFAVEPVPVINASTDAPA
jgi:superfamily II DNA or RNA helicase